MKLILNCYYNNRTNVSSFNASLIDDSIYFGLNQNEKLPVFAFKELPSSKKHILRILEYRISDMLSHELSKDVNTQIKVQYYSRTETLYTKLNYFQKQRLKFILNDHFIQRDGNWKTILGGIATFISLFLIYLTYKQGDKLSIQEIEITNLKDSVNKYQNLVNYKAL